MERMQSGARLWGMFGAAQAERQGVPQAYDWSSTECGKTTSCGCRGHLDLRLVMPGHLQHPHHASQITSSTFPTTPMRPATLILCL